MKIIELKNRYGAQFIMFELETEAEKDFFKNLPDHRYNLPKNIRNWLMAAQPPALIGFSNGAIGIRYGNEFSYGLFNQPPPIYDFLNYLYENKIIAENLTEKVKELINPQYNQELIAQHGIS